MNVFFRLAALAGAVFIVTILALVAAVFGSPQAPPAKFLEEHGGRLIACEVAAVLVCGVLALTIDRRQILRDRRTSPQAHGSQPVGQEPRADEPR